MALIIGDNGNGSLTGTEDADTLQGLGGSDTLSGLGGADLLEGGNGDDFLTGGAGNDTLDGGADFDYAFYNDSSDPIVADMATGLVTRVDGTDLLIDVELVRGGGGADSFAGGDGDDHFAGGPGADTLVGGDGFDHALYVWAAAGVTVDLSTGTSSGADGNDTLSGIEYLSGSPYADTLIGDDGDNWLSGRTGNDTIVGGGGIDTVRYHRATGGVTVDLEAGTSSGADGNDQISGVENIYGGPFSDSLYGDGGDNRIEGGPGQDFLYGRGGNDTLVGAAGDSDFIGYTEAPGPVLVDMAAGTASGASGNDVFTDIYGVFGSGYDDTLLGGDADDYLRGNGGDDSIDGGAGFDWSDYRNAPAGGVTVNLATGAVTGADGNDTLVAIEAVRGSNSGDLLVGDAYDANWFNPMGGNDTIDGGGGRNDRVDYNNASNGVVVDLAAGTATGSGNDTLIGINAVRGSAYGDHLIGNDAINLLRGGLGDDTIDGGPNFDIVEYIGTTSGVTVDLAAGTASGGHGNDTLLDIEGIYGSGFGDHLIGDAGDNLLRGNSGADTIDGGEGQDVADYRSASGPITVDMANGIFTGEVANDTLISIEGFYGTSYDDLLIGDDGDNFLGIGVGGVDTLDGGAGYDTISFLNAPVGVRVNLATSTVEAADGGTGLDGMIPIISGFEAVFASEFDDHLIGTAGDNEFRGWLGDDTLEGGDGFDIANYELASGGVTVDLGTGSSSGPDGNDTLIGIEGVRGSDLGDTLTGDAGDNLLSGWGGDDVLDGGGGFDTARFDGAIAEYTIVTAGGTTTVTHSGDEGTDTLTDIELLSFADTDFALSEVTGTDGDDTLSGSRGNDTLAGGDGIDTAVFDGDSSQFTWTLDSTGTVTLTDTGGNEGSDALIDIEIVQFGDRSIEVEDLVFGQDTIRAFFNTATGQTLYTSDVAEAAAWSQDADIRPLAAEYAAPLDTDAGVIPVYRVYSTVFDLYLWTGSAAVRDAVLAEPGIGIVDQGVAFHAHADEASGGSSAIHMLWDWNPTATYAGASAPLNILYTDEVLLPFLDRPGDAVSDQGVQFWL